MAQHSQALDLDAMRDDAERRTLEEQRQKFPFEKLPRHLQYNIAEYMNDPNDPSELGKFATLNKNTKSIADNLDVQRVSRATRILQIARERWGDELVDYCIEKKNNHFTLEEFNYLIYAYAPNFAFVVLTPQMDIDYSKFDPVKLFVDKYNIPSLTMARQWAEDMRVFPGLSGRRGTESCLTAWAQSYEDVPMPRDRRYQVQFFSNYRNMFGEPRLLIKVKKNANDNFIRPSDLARICVDAGRIELTFSQKYLGVIPFSTKYVLWYYRPITGVRKLEAGTPSYVTRNTNYVTPNYKPGEYPIIIFEKATNGDIRETLLRWVRCP